MKKKSTSRSAFFNLRVLIGAFVISIGMLLALLAIGAFSNAPRAYADNANGVSHITPIADDRDPEFVKKRDEFLRTFFGRGPGGVSPSQFATALAAARALPPSPLLQGGPFMPQASWTFPISPPITNSYGADGTARVQALAIDPTNTNVVYTGSFGGLAKTTDGGSTWQYLSDMWTSQSVTAIAIDYDARTPGSNKIVYVGTGREDYGPYGVGIYRSFDEGVTWSGPLGAAQLAGKQINAIATTGSGAQTNATVYVASSAGLYRSTNSGSTWTLVFQRPSYPSGVWDVAKDPWSSAIYLTDYDGMFKSVDGQNWTQIFSSAGWQNKLRLVTPRRTFSSWLYFINPDDPIQNLYKSTNGGSNWTQIPTHCPCPPDVCADPNPPNCASSCADRCGNIGFSVFAVDPANPQIIVAGGYPRQAGTISLFRTDNEGASWTELSPWYGPIHADQHACEFSREGEGGRVYVGNDGGIIKSTDSGSNWTNLNHNFPGALLYSVAVSRDGRMIAGTQDHGVVFSNLGPWDAIFGGDSGRNLIDTNDSANAYWVIYDVPNYGYNRFNRTTYQSTDITPAQIRNETFSFFPAFSMNPLSPTHVIAAGQHVVRTLDAPNVTTETWTTIGGAVAGTLRAVKATAEAPSDANFIYAITTSSNLVTGSNVKLTRNANNGTSATWTDVSSNLSNTGDKKSISVDPTNPQIAYLAADHAIYKTTNAGGSWSQIAIPDLVYYDVAVAPDQPQHIFAAANAGVFESSNGGLTWANMSNGIPSGMAVTSLSLDPARRKIAASTYGRGVYTASYSRLP